MRCQGAENGGKERERQRKCVSYEECKKVCVEKGE